MWTFAIKRGASVNASSAETVIAASLMSLQISHYSKVEGLQEWVSDFQEFSSHLVERYRARYDFKLEGDVLWVSMQDLEEMGTSGWEKPLIPAKGAEQKLIAQMADRLSAARRVLPASPAVAATSRPTVGPQTVAFSGVRPPVIPGSNSVPEPRSREAVEPPPMPAPPEPAPTVRSAPGQPPTIVDISLGMPYAAAHKIGTGLYPQRNWQV